MVSDSTVARCCVVSAARSFAASLSKASLGSTVDCSIRLLHSSECLPRISHRRQPAVVPCGPRMCRVRYVLCDRSVVHSSLGRADAGCSPALARMDLLGVHGLPTQMFKNSLSQDPYSQNSTCQCSLRGQQREFIGCLVPANKHTFHTSEFQCAVVSIMFFFFLKKKKNCTSSLSYLWSTCIRACCSSVTLDSETVEYPGTVTYHPAHQAMICLHVNFVIVHQVCSWSSKLPLYRQVYWFSSPNQDCSSILMVLRSLSALLLCIGSPSPTVLGDTSARP